jgi:serine/threonine-protein kinase HipA
MAALANVTAVDVLGMLARFGRDVAGAVVVAPPDTDAPATREGHAVRYAEGELARAVADLDDHPLGLYEDSELSIAGIQDKMLLVERDDGWGRPVHGYPSTHILKVDDRVHTGLVRAEHECLSLARAVGLDAARTRLLRVGDADCIVVDRFDRKPGRGNPAQRLHCEDACQALGVDPEAARGRAKYESYGGPSLRDIAAVLESFAADPESGLLALLERVVFTVAIGDADAHGKNLALMHDRPGTIRLAPLFDCVPTALWPALRTDAAMLIGGVRDLRRVRVNDIVHEATSWGLSRTTSAAAAARVLEALAGGIDGHPTGVDSPALQLIAQRLTGLA